MIGLLVLLAFAVWRYTASDLPNAFTTEFPSDLKVYLLGGEKVAHHQPLYEADLLPGLPFTYPPFAGVVFSWLAESTVLGVAWKAASVLVLLLVVRAGTDRHALLLTAVFVLCLSPVQGTLYFGQINLLLMGLVCLDFLPRVKLPGIGVGLAAGIKLTPAFFVLLFIQQRRWGAVFIAAFTFLCTVATGFSEVTDAKHFWTDAIFATSRIGTDDNPGAQSIRQVLARAGMDSPWLWLILASAVTALALIASRRAPAPLAASFIGMTACLVSPFSWYHHWVWIVPMLVWVYNRWGVLVLALCMVPYAAANISAGLFTIPDVVFISVPVGFMLWYTLRSGHAHSSNRRHNRGRHSPDPRPLRSR